MRKTPKSHLDPDATDSWVRGALLSRAFLARVGRPQSSYLSRCVKKHVLILGAGFAGLELAARLSDSLADEVRVTLLDKNDSFYFGFSKLDVLFGAKTRLTYCCTAATSPRRASSFARRA
jgi:heterodisulfide reductase subunit A-like polyferredoxin